MTQNVEIDEVCRITRRPRGRGFEYFDRSGKKIRCRRTLKRIKGLTIPPMWQRVGISELHDSHVQAVGCDAKTRRQYIYHPDWLRQRQLAKFKRLATFASGLPDFRARFYKDAKQQDWNEKKVCAIATSVLDQTGMRIGNQYYTQQNDTYGLTTLRRKHMDVQDGDIFLHYRGKHNQSRDVRLDDDALVKLIIQSAEQPGYSLFRFKRRGKWLDISSDDVNDYIRSVTGDDFSAKDFRTWAGTRLAIALAHDCQQVVKDNPRKNFRATLVKRVAGALGNTPKICEEYYIHPDVLKGIVEKDHQGNTFTQYKLHPVLDEPELIDSEKAALHFIKPECAKSSSQ
ncbi:DNA topoisomerase IB [Alteromonas oceanisediminis]|uniref:DNA topoisomerase IB n=1 Tax=Alteromonas oceanisediminis TaxID=2836180 RepID=UPI001BDB41C2|nr:DNA topoisomerase IB [Alteromonas oceanisediminis]MBT0586687.1 DNA topoisomerase IB [Alteromonas oceanisediminis]